MGDLPRMRNAFIHFLLHDRDWPTQNKTSNFTWIMAIEEFLVEEVSGKT